METSACEKLGALKCGYLKLLEDIGLGWRDLATAANRVTNEGLAFLTKRLPALGKAFDRGLGDAYFVLPSGFQRSRRGSEIPAFCGSLFRQVFEDNGLLREDANPTAVKHIRVLCFFAYKFSASFDESVHDRVVQEFADKDDEIPPLKVHWITVQARKLTTEIFKDFSYEDCPNPFHGKGVVSNIKRFDKWNYYPPSSTVVEHFGRSSFNHVEETKVFNFVYFLYALAFGFIDVDLPQVTSYKPTAKVLLVPKDSRGPRIISCEPAEHMYIQQAIRIWTQNRLEGHPLSKGNVNFEKQEINRNLVLEHSKTLRYSTLDLKDASDRVSLELVEYLFGDAEVYLKSILACRSEFTLIEKTSGPFHHKLRKFAPMGSALCFTTLAFVIFSLLMADLLSQGVPLADAKQVFFVYGDDVVIETWYAQRAMDILEYHGLLVNHDKSFIKSRFLESCGMDAFDGHPVTPVRARDILPLPKTPKKCKTKRQVNFFQAETAAQLLKTVALANTLAKHGYQSCAEYFYSLSEQYLQSRLPYGTDKSPMICRELQDPADSWRYNSVESLEKMTREGPVISSFSIKSLSQDSYESCYGRLRRVLHIMGQEVTVPELGEFVVPKTYTLRRRNFRRYYDTAYAAQVTTSDPCPKQTRVPGHKTVQNVGEWFRLTAVVGK